MSDQGPTGPGNQQPPGGWSPPPGGPPQGPPPGPPQGPPQGPPPGQPWGGQPGGYAPPPAVPDYLVWAILETVLCCLPLGIAAIIYASRANSKKATGDIHGAMEDAATAKKMLIIGVAIGAVIVVLYLIIAVLGAAFGGSGSSSDF